MKKVLIAFVVSGLGISNFDCYAGSSIPRFGEVKGYSSSSQRIAPVNDKSSSVTEIIVKDDGYIVACLIGRERELENKMKRLERRVKVLQWTVGTAAVIGGGVVAYYLNPNFAKFVNAVPSYVSKLVHSVSGFIEKKSPGLREQIKNLIKEVEKNVLEVAEQNDLEGKVREMLNVVMQKSDELRELLHKQ